MADVKKPEFNVHSHIADMLYRIERHLHGMNQTSVPGLHEDVMRLRRHAAGMNENWVAEHLNRRAFSLRLPERKPAEGMARPQQQAQAPKPADDRPQQQAQAPKPADDKKS